MPKTIQQKKARRSYDSLQAEDVCVALESMAGDDDQRKALRNVGLVISRVLSDVGEITATIRGENGHDGLIARVAVIEETIADIKLMQGKILDAILAGNKASIKATGENKKDSGETAPDKNPVNITFQWLLEKMILPSLIPLTVSLMLILVTDVMPKLMILFNGIDNPLK